MAQPQLSTGKMARFVMWNLLNMSANLCLRAWIKNEGSQILLHTFSSPLQFEFQVVCTPIFSKTLGTIMHHSTFSKKKKNPINYLLLEEEWMLMAIKWTDGDMGGGKKSHRNNAQTKIYFNRYIKGILCLLTQKQSLSIIVLETSGSVCAETLLRACVSHIFPVLGTFLMWLRDNTA